MLQDSPDKQSAFRSKMLTLHAEPISPTLVPCLKQSGLPIEASMV